MEVKVGKRIITKGGRDRNDKTIKAGELERSLYSENSVLEINWKKYCSITKKNWSM